MYDMDELDIAWAAGFIDGEGCMYLKRHRNDMSNISVLQADRRPLDKLVDLFGGRVTVNRVDQGKNGGKTHYQWFLADAPSICVALTAMLPYFRVKQEQARILLEFATIKVNKIEFRISPTERIARDNLIGQMATIRASGV